MKKINHQIITSTIHKTDSMGRKTEKSYVTFTESFLKKIDSEAEE